MPEFIIRCPAPQCGQSLKLKSEARGQPLSCPYCATAIGLTWNADGTPGMAKALGSKWRVPRPLLLPGFALLLLGVASAFANGYVAYDAATRPGADLEHARRQVQDLRNTQSLTAPSEEAKKKKGTEPTPQDVFSALAGQAARLSYEADVDETFAVTWSRKIVGVHLGFFCLSAVIALGSVAFLGGRAYWLAMVGCVAAVLNVNNLCCLPGFIIGLWGFLQLIRDEGRLHFGLMPSKK